MSRYIGSIGHLEIYVGNLVIVGGEFALFDSSVNGKQVRASIIQC